MFGEKDEEILERQANHKTTFEDVWKKIDFLEIGPQIKNGEFARKIDFLEVGPKIKSGELARQIDFLEVGPKIKDGTLIKHVDFLEVGPKFEKYMKNHYHLDFGSN